MWGLLGFIRANLPMGVLGDGGRREAVAPDFVVLILLIGVIKAQRKAVQRFLPCTSLVSTL